MIKKTSLSRLALSGSSNPSLGAVSPVLLASALALFAVACGGSQETSRNLATSEVGMTNMLAPIFDDGETKIYEVKRGLQFPIVQPDANTMSSLEGEATDPYGRQPWLTTADSKVQLTWTLTNVDTDPHAVEVIIDPWNEFGRYWPGMQVANEAEQELKPNLSGIDYMYPLEGSGAGDASRKSGTYTFDDMNEMAIDFATVMNLIKYPPPPPADADAADPNATLTGYINHAFNVQNRSYNDPYIAAGSPTHPGTYVPATIAGLTGVDFGIRTFESANIAFEVSVEIVDLGNHRVQEEGSDAILLPPTTNVITVGTAAP
ncbi:MAG TPA: hypothetical protein VGI10_29715 [Polyangiaceae bacterium]|jgi:hypothetical protein